MNKQTNVNRKKNGFNLQFPELKKGRWNESETNKCKEMQEKKKLIEKKTAIELKKKKKKKTVNSSSSFLQLGKNCIFTKLLGGSVSLFSLCLWAIAPMERNTERRKNRKTSKRSKQQTNNNWIYNISSADLFGSVSTFLNMSKRDRSVRSYDDNTTRTHAYPIHIHTAHTAIACIETPFYCKYIRVRRARTSTADQTANIGMKVFHWAFLHGRQFLTQWLGCVWHMLARERTTDQTNNNDNFQFNLITSNSLTVRVKFTLLSNTHHVLVLHLYARLICGAIVVVVVSARASGWPLKHFCIQCVVCRYHMLSARSLCLSLAPPWLLPEKFAAKANNAVQTC